MVSCGDTTQVGSGLLEDQDLEILFEDDFLIEAKTILTEPTVTFTSLNNPIESHLVGELNDPQFGRSTASFYFQMRYFNTILPDYSSADLDSAVLMLQIDTTVLYGSRNDNLTFEVFRLKDNIVDIDTITSDDSFLIDASPIGVLQDYGPGSRREFAFFDPVFRSTIRLDNVIRIPIDNAFAQELLDTPIEEDMAADQLLEDFSGFFIRASSEGSSMMAFDLSGTSENSIFSLYYTPADTISTVFNYLLGFDRPVQFSHDITGTDVSEVLNSVAGPDDLLYVQGMNGPDVEIDLSDLFRINDNIILNHAELEVTVAIEAIGDTSLYPISPALGLYKFNDAGVYVPVDDLEIASRTGAREILFDGTVLNESSEFTYTMNFSSHAKDILNGIENTKVYLSVFNKGDNPSRTILYGPQAPLNPLKLRVTYTKL